MTNEEKLVPEKVLLLLCVYISQRQTIMWTNLVLFANFAKISFIKQPAMQPIVLKHVTEWAEPVPSSEGHRFEPGPSTHAGP